MSARFTDTGEQALDDLTAYAQTHQEKSMIAPHDDAQFRLDCLKLATTSFSWNSPTDLNVTGDNIMAVAERFYAFVSGDDRPAPAKIAA